MQRVVTTPPLYVPLLSQYKTVCHRFLISKYIQTQHSNIVTRPPPIGLATIMACASDNNLESVELALQIPLPTSSSTLDLNSRSVSVVLQSDIPSVDSVASIHRNQSSLPPVDRGFGAWSFVRIPSHGMHHDLTPSSFLS